MISVKCNIAPHIQFGTWGVTFLYDNATLTCNTNYQLTGSGPKTIHCFDNGTWSKTNVSCHESKVLSTMINAAKTLIR